MAVAVNFYNIKKMINSTAAPAAGDGVMDVSCNVRDGCGILNPVLELLLPQSLTNIALINYAYIAAFNRYYWVDEAKYINRKWVFSMHVDVLGTYKAAIGAASRFVYRAQSEVDPMIIDDAVYRKCLTKTSITQTTTGLIPPTNLENGTFIVGIVGRDDAPGMVSYYALTANQMSVFRRYLLSIASDDSASDWETFGQKESEGETVDTTANISAGVIKSIVDPFKYIVSCLWLPINGITGTDTTIKFGFWESTLHGLALGSDVVKVISRTIEAPARDDAATMPGMYCNCPPFAKLELYYPPFESLEIPPSAAVFSGITTVLTIDLITGVGILQVYVDNGVNIVCQSTAQLGVPFQISQINNDYMNAVDPSTWIAGGAALGQIIGSALGGANVIGGAPGSVLSASLSTVKIAGTSGGFGSLNNATIAKLILRYTDISDADNNNIGRPLCKVRTLNSLSGFIQCRPGRIACPGTETEKEEIEKYLEEGFFYE